MHKPSAKLPNKLEPRVCADDAHPSYAGDDIDNIQLHGIQNLENVCNWLIANKLTLHISKKPNSCFSDLYRG